MRGVGVLLLSVAGSGAVRAQEAPADTARLSDIVVTATRLPVRRAAVASVVTVLTGADLRSRGIRYAADALRSVPGVMVVQNGSFGAATSVFLRGGESDYVHVLVDGVQLNGSGGVFDWGSLTTDNIDRIEIVAGPTSVLYGSDAVSGVVQIFTRRGEGAPTVEAGARAGSYGTSAFDGGFRGSARGLDYSLAVSRFATDGILAYNNENRNAVASGRFHVAPDARTDATVTVRYTTHTFHFPTNSAGVLDDRNQFTFTDGTGLSLDLGRRLGDRLEARLLLSSHEVDGGFDDRPDGPADTLGFFGSQSLSHFRRRTTDLRLNLSPRTGVTFTAGARLEGQAERGVSQSQSQFGPFTSSSDYDRANRGVYGQALLEPVGGVALTIGGRVDDNEAFGTFGTYRAGASARVTGGTRVRVSVGTGFKEPTFFENFATGFTRGNPNLSPEHSTGWEVGLEQEVGGRVRASATYFRQRFRDLIQFNPAPIGPADPHYVNIAMAEARGLEATLTAALPGLTVAAAYTNLATGVTDAGFDTGPDATFVEGAPLLRRPRHAGSVSLTSALSSRAALGVAVRHVGRRWDRDFALFPAPRVVLPGYTVADVFTEVALLRVPVSLTLAARVENLAGARYAEILNFPARGRTVVVGARAGR